MTVDVLVLAGARNEGALRQCSSSKHEALIEIADAPMVEYVLRALNRAEKTGRVVIVGPKKELEDSLKEKVELVVESGESMLENIKKGITALDPDNYILIITSDIPLITEGVIDEFISICLEDSEADIYYPIIPKKENLARFPTVKRTYIHLAEGIFTGGNMVLLNPEVMKGALDVFEKAIIWRKKPWKLSQLLGMKFIFKFVIGNLSLEEIEKRVAKITGYKGKGLITEHAEIGFDVDKPSDLILMRDKYIL